jgi:putative transposase
VIDVLAQFVCIDGAPRSLRSGNGPEFVTCAVLRLAARRVDRNGPRQSREAVAECDRRIVQVPREHLTLHWLRRIDANVSIEQWRRHYNEVRSNLSLEYLTPMEFKAT